MSQDHVLVFVATHGPGPYPCLFCGEDVEMLKRSGGLGMVVHHLDHDRRHNEPANLAALHASCHGRHHLTLKWQQPGERGRRVPNISKAATGRKHPEDCTHCVKVRAKAGVKHPKDCGHCAAVRGSKRPDVSERLTGQPGYWTGKTMSAEHKRHIGEAARGRRRTPAERAAISEGQKRSWERRRAS